MDSKDTASLDEIRTSFVNDGLRWAMEPEKKLIHLWKKVQRTEEALRESSIEVHLMRKQHKEEISNFQNAMKSIRQLSSEKEAITISLEEENLTLSKTISQIAADNEKLTKEIAAASELCLAEGITDDSSEVPKDPIKYLIAERSQFMEKIRRSDGEVIRLNEEVQKAKKEMSKTKSAGTLVQQLTRCKSDLEKERASLASVKADHVKQHKLHQKQFHELKSKLSKYESGASPSGEDQQPVGAQLYEALLQIGLLTSQLNQSTKITEETEQSNAKLHERLSKANLMNEELSRKLDVLSEEMSEERETSISVLEEQLQKEHDLQNSLEVSQLSVQNWEGKVEALEEELQKEQNLHEEMQDKIKTLEQSLYIKQSLSSENDFLQQSMSEKEKNIDILEKELEAVKTAYQNLSRQSTAHEDEIKEHVCTIEDIEEKIQQSKELSNETNKKRLLLQEKIDSLQEENGRLRESLDDTRRVTDRTKIEIKSLKDQNENQSALVDSQLSVIQTEKEDLINLLEEESARQDKVRDSLNSTISQLQDELHSKCEEISRAQLENQQILKEATSLKQNLEIEVVSKRESEQQLETLQNENKKMCGDLAQLEAEMESKASQAIITQHARDSQIHNKEGEIEDLQARIKSVSLEAEENKAALTIKLETLSKTKEIELDELKSELNAGKEKNLVLESELESRDIAFKNALNTKEAIKDEKASLQAQIAVFKSKKITLEQQLHVTRDSLESEKSRCRSLNDAAESRELKLLATQQELEESKEQSVSLTKKAEESGKQVKIILSSLNKMRAALTEKENECEKIIEDRDEMESNIKKMEQNLDVNEEKIRELEDQLSEAVKESDQVRVKYQAKEEELAETVSRLLSVDSLWSKTQTALEEEEVQNSKLKQENILSQLNENKFQEQIEELLQENDNYQDRIKKLQSEKIKISSTSRRIESKLAKKIKELAASEEKREETEERIEKIKLELPGLRDKEVERNISMENEMAALREQLHHEKTQKLLKEQAISSMQEKMDGLEETRLRLETTLREKQREVYEGEVAVREQKRKALKAKEKKIEVVCEKDLLEEEVKLLQGDVSRYRAEVTQLQEKVERYKMKYEDRKKQVKERLSKSLTKFTKDKWSLEFSIDVVKEELHAAKRKLDCECRWKDTAESIHKVLCEEKSEMKAKLVATEEILRERSRQIVELGVKGSRLQKENIMLEERNKMLITHVQLSASSPSPNELNTPLFNSTGFHQPLFSSSSPSPTHGHRLTSPTSPGHPGHLFNLTTTYPSGSPSRSNWFSFTSPSPTADRHTLLTSPDN